MLAASRRQRALTEEVAQAAEAGVAESSMTIEAMRPVSAILADWREAERVALEAEPGSTAQAEAERMVDRFRDEYRQAFEAAKRQAP